MDHRQSPTESPTFPVSVSGGIDTLGGFTYIDQPMLHSGKARINHDATQRRVSDSIKTQQLRQTAINVYESARYDASIDARHLETLRIKAYGA